MTMLIYTLPDGRQLTQGQAFELNGKKFSRAWLAKATPEMLAAYGITVEEVPPPEPEPPTLDDYRIAIQTHIDATARQRDYDGGVSCASYVNSTNPQWAAEAQAFVAWRDAVWAHAFTELDKVQQELRAQPTVEEFLLELPMMQWPEPD